MNIEQFQQVPNGSIVARDLLVAPEIRWMKLCHVAVKISQNEVIDFTSKPDTKYGHQIQRKSVHAFFADGTTFRGIRYSEYNKNPALTKKWAEYFHYLAINGRLYCKYDLLFKNCYHFCLACIQGKIPKAHEEFDLASIICRYLIGD